MKTFEIALQHKLHFEEMKRLENNILQINFYLAVKKLIEITVKYQIISIYEENPKLQHKYKMQRKQYGQEYIVEICCVRLGR